MSKSLVLIGGGHSHAIALQSLGVNPISDINITLISDVAQTPYSGMLPGHVAGFYSYEETHIDLRRLAEFARVNLVIDRAVKLDLANHRVICQSKNAIAFDYLSLDIGSIPQAINVPGAKEYAIPAKPVPIFLAGWSELLGEIRQNSAKSRSIAIIGGGAGGVELALNMQARFKREGGENIEINLIHRGTELLSNHNHRVSKILEKLLRDRQIKLHLQQNVIEVLPDKIICESGLTIRCDCTFWITQASVPPWIRKSSLTTDDRGFILVSNTLQSVSHPQIFAAGDNATIINYPRPKAGVFAVRQGKPLVENWRRIIAGKPLKPYYPQSKYLALISTGDKSAIASWGNFGARSPLFWYLKDYIDRKFMNQFP
ncbi:MAG: FAD-dependent oxidoreductase [Pleurocapsa sp.]